MTSPTPLHPRLAALALILATTPLEAAEVKAVSTITAVTIYPDGAVVTRLAEADIPAGSHEVVFERLPLGLDPASLQVSASADAAISLGAVDSRQRPGEPGQPGREVEERLKGLKAERDRLADRIEAEEGKKRMIERFARFGAGEDDDEDRRPPLDLAEWTKAWDLVGQGLAGVNASLRVLKTDDARLEKEIAALEAIDPGRNPAQPAREVRVAVDTATAVRAKVSISYRIGGASWRPIYDARLTTGSPAPSITLERRALISQRTGEDWTEAALTLSTVRVSRGTSSPDLPSEKLAFVEPEPPRPAAPEASALRDELAQSAKRGEERSQAFRFTAGSRNGSTAAERQQAILDAGAFQAEYRVPGKVNVPADGSEKGVLLSSGAVGAVLRHRSAPALDQTAYLEAEIAHKEDAPILPGEVFLRRDGVFVGRGRVALIALGDTFMLGFGADERVKVTRAPLKRLESEPGLLGSTRTDERIYKTVAKNLHAFPVKLVIHDRVPFSEDASITVETIPGSTPPNESNVKDKRGVFAWTADLKPQEEREFRLAYRIRWPADKRLRQAQDR